jgi:hypothetical protein
MFPGLARQASRKGYSCIGVFKERLNDPCPVESLASSTQLKSPPSRMSVEAMSNIYGSTLLKKFPLSSILAVPEGA